MKNTKFEELSEYQRKRLETAEECANDIKKYEEQTKKTVSPKVRKFILDMYLFGLEYDSFIIKITLGLFLLISFVFSSFSWVSFFMLSILFFV